MSTQRKIYLFFMYGTWNIFSMCHHEENMRRWYAVYFPSSATWKCIFFINEAFFFIFSHLLSQLFRQFFASRAGNSSDFPFLCFSFEDGAVEMCRMKFSFHEIHVNVPDNMNLNSLFCSDFYHLLVTFYTFYSKTAQNVWNFTFL